MLARIAELVRRQFRVQYTLAGMDCQRPRR
jgi:hypothetical protein